MVEVFEPNHPIDAIFRFIHACCTAYGTGRKFRTRPSTLMFLNAARRNVKLLEGPNTGGWNNEERLISGSRRGNRCCSRHRCGCRCTNERVNVETGVQFVAKVRGDCDFGRGGGELVGIKEGNGHCVPAVLGEERGWDELRRILLKYVKTVIKIEKSREKF